MDTDMVAHASGPFHLAPLVFSYFKHIHIHTSCTLILTSDRRVRQHTARHLCLIRNLVKRLNRSSFQTARRKSWTETRLQTNKLFLQAVPHDSRVHLHLKVCVCVCVLYTQDTFSPVYISPFTLSDTGCVTVLALSLLLKCCYSII